MKILHVIPSMEIGGAQRLIADMLPILSQYPEVETTLLVFKPIQSVLLEHVEKSGIKVLSINAKKYYSVFNIFKLYETIKRYDIVHLHCTPALYSAALIKPFCKAKFVYTEHSTSGRLRRHSFLRLIEKFVYDRCDKIISISDGTESALKSWVRLKTDDKFITIPNGIDLSKFSKRRSEKNKDLIMVSRFVTAKDQKTVIEAMQFLDTSIKLMLVGDGPTMKSCIDLVAFLNLNDRVSFLGSRSDIPELLSNAAIGIQSSNWEGFGLSAVEMMASGLPVIASDVEGLSQVVSGAGLLFEKGNARDLALRIQTLLGDSNIYNEVASSCLKRAELYDIKNTAHGYWSVYQELLSNG